MFPFSIVRVWLVGLLALIIIEIVGYLAWDWYRYDRDDRQLYWAIGLGAVALVSRLPLMPFFGLGSGPPRLRPVESTYIRAADGTQLRVHILKRGAGPVVILTHGWSLNTTVWGYAQKELPKECTLVAWDLRGLGESSKSTTNDYSLETMAGDLLEVLTYTAKGQPAVLVGHSIGGMICQTFCRLFPDQVASSVKSIALCDTTFTNPVNTARGASVWKALEKPVLVPLLHLTIWLSPIVWLMNILSYLNGSTQLTTRLSSFAGSQTWGQVDFVSRLSSFASPAVVARGMLAMLKFGETEALPSITCPVAVLVGADDRLTRPEASQFIASHVKLGKLMSLTPGGHLSILERHESLNGALSAVIHQAAKDGDQARAIA